jgi:hypothetical protein
MHPPEPIYPCYLPVLGEFNRMTPHEGPSTSLPEVIEPSESALALPRTGDMSLCGLVRMDISPCVPIVPVDMSPGVPIVPVDMSPVRAKDWAVSHKRRNTDGKWC